MIHALQVDEELSTGEQLSDEDIIELVTKTMADDYGLNNDDDDNDDGDSSIQDLVCQPPELPMEITHAEAKRSAETLISYFEQISEQDNTKGLACSHKLLDIINSRVDLRNNRQTKISCVLSNKRHRLHQQIKYLKGD